MIKLKDLEENSIKELLYYLNTLEIPYRDIININNKKMTFGVELEFLGLFYDDIEKMALENKFTLPLESALTQTQIDCYSYTTETSLSKNGCEIISPILSDKKSNWHKLKMMCDDLIKHGAKSNECSTHMHFGAHVLNNNYNNWINLVKIWITYEKILYNFYYGEDEYPRKSIFLYAKSINDIRFNNLDNLRKDKNLIQNLKLLFSNDTYIGKQLGLNIFRVSLDHDIEYKNTIEVRIPNATLNHKIIQNNVNLFAKLLTSIIGNKIDYDYLNNKFYNREIVSDINLFNNFSYLDALEFGDMIFCLDIDKYYYLKQLYKLYNLSEEKLNKKVTRILNK